MVPLWLVHLLLHVMRNVQFEHKMIYIDKLKKIVIDFLYPWVTIDCKKSSVVIFTHRVFAIFLYLQLILYTLSPYIFFERIVFDIKYSFFFNFLMIQYLMYTLKLFAYGLKKTASTMACVYVPFLLSLTCFSGNGQFGILNLPLYEWKNNIGIILTIVIFIISLLLFLKELFLSGADIRKSNK